MRFLLLVAFVSSCGQLKIDKAHAWSIRDRGDALVIVANILGHQGSCLDVEQFLDDSALNHGLLVEPCTETEPNKAIVSFEKSKK